MPGADAAEHVHEGPARTGAGHAVRRRAQHEHAAQEGQKANPADDGEHGAEQGVVIGAPATVTEAGGGRRAPGAEQALAACREPGGDAHHDQANQEAERGAGGGGPVEAVLRDPQQPHRSLDEGGQAEQVAGGGDQRHQTGIEVPDQRYQRPAQVSSAHRSSPDRPAARRTSPPGGCRAGCGPWSPWARRP